jgi:hypothetical protein
VWGCVWGAALRLEQQQQPSDTMDQAIIKRVVTHLPSLMRHQFSVDISQTGKQARQGLILILHSKHLS